MKGRKLTVAEGLPDEPDPSDVDALCAVPGPGSFFERLFGTLAGVSVHKSTAVIESSTKDDDWAISKGYCGKKDVGLRFQELRCLETSDVAMRCTWETYGLPGIQVRWEFFLEKAGQLGFAAFRHKTLHVDFQDERDRAAFADIWQQVFNRAPVFYAEAPE